LRGGSIVWYDYFFSFLTSDEAANSLASTPAGLNMHPNARSPVIADLIKAFHDLDVESAALAGMIAGLTNTLGNLNMSIDKPWPPVYFPMSGMVVLANANVVASPGGINPHNPGHLDVPANARSPSSNLRTALCRLALSHFVPSNNWALYLTPVGLLNSLARRDWHATIGAEASVFSIAQSFLDYAADALRMRRRTFAVGLFTHWLNWKDSDLGGGERRRDLQSVLGRVHVH
jgi:hypothetical protein